MGSTDCQSFKAIPPVIASMNKEQKCTDVRTVSVHEGPRAPSCSSWDHPLTRNVHEAQPSRPSGLGDAETAPKSLSPRCCDYWDRN